MPITSFTIGGVEVDPLLDTLDIRETTGDVSTLSCDVESIGSPVMRFSVHQAVVVQADGVTIFAGTVTQTRERGFGGPNLYDVDTGAEQIVTTITAEDYANIGQRVYVTETVADGTVLKTFLTTLITNYLSALGVSLDGSQVNGPNLPAMTFTRQTGSDVLKALADATGYLYRIDYDKHLRMWLPGDLTAPFNIDEYDSPARWTDDVEVENILGDTYANKVTVTSDPLTEIRHQETFPGDGSTTTFSLEWTLTHAYGYCGTSTNPYETLNYTGDTQAATWTYDAATNSITRNTGAPAVGETVIFVFDGTFQAEATAQDAGEIALYGVYEYVTQVSNITTTAAAQSIADQILAERLNSGSQTATFSTRYTAPSLRAGQQMTIAATGRGLSGDYIVQSLEVRAETPATAVYAPDLGLIRAITVKQSQLLTGKWQQTFRDWLQGTGGSTVSTTIGTGAARSGPGGPDTAVQYNDGGTFGGDDAFTYNKLTNSLVMGNLSSVTAASPESCAAIGYDCHVSD